MKHNRGLEKLGLELWRNFELNSTLNEMIVNEDIYTKQIKYLAKLRWTKYKALLKEGFDEQQSLYLLEKTNLFG